LFCFSLSCFSANYRSSFLFINYSFWDLASCSSASIYWLFDTCLSYFKRYRYASCMYSSCEVWHSEHCYCNLWLVDTNSKVLFLIVYIQIASQ